MRALLRLERPLVRAGAAALRLVADRRRGAAAGPRGRCNIGAVTARRLDGTLVARQIQEELRRELEALRARGVRPGLGALLVGDDPASAVYVRSKTQALRGAGALPRDPPAAPRPPPRRRCWRRSRTCNRRPDIHGILVQLPLPSAGRRAARARRGAIRRRTWTASTPRTSGGCVQKRPRFVPCTPAGIMELLRRSGVPLAGRRAVVLGRSEIVGKPMALLLMHADATVTVCHSRTRELAAVTREADVLVAAIGRPGLVRAAHVKPGAVVVDVGMNRVERPGARARAARARSASPSSSAAATRSWATCTRRRCAEVAGRAHARAGRRGPADDRDADGEHGPGRRGRRPEAGRAARGADRRHRVRQVARAARGSPARGCRTLDLDAVGAGGDRAGQPGARRDRGGLRRAACWTRDGALDRAALAALVFADARGPRAAQRHRAPARARGGGALGRGLRRPAGRRCS